MSSKGFRPEPVGKANIEVGLLRVGCLMENSPEEKKFEYKPWVFIVVEGVEDTQKASGTDMRTCQVCRIKPVGKTTLYIKEMIRSRCGSKGCMGTLKCRNKANWRL